MSSPTIVQTPLDALAVLSQVRQHFDEASIDGLARSIHEVGLLQPIRARRHADKLVIVDGERRYRAARKAGLQSVPVIIEDRDLSAAELAQTQLIANCQREDLKPVEKARAISQLMKASGWPATQVAAKLGLPDAAVTRSLAVLTLPQPIREQVNAGAIPASAAYDLARIKDPEQQAELARQLAERSLTRDGLAGIAKAQRNPSPAAPGPHAKRATVVLSNTCSVTLADDALDLDRFITALEEALAKARQARRQGIELKTFCQMLKDKAKG